jgi:uncharacterized protein (TIGR00251 family)
MRPVTLAVKVRPRSGRDCVCGWDGEDRNELVVNVRATAEGGKANAAVCGLIARELNVPRSAVVILRGQTARHKLLAIDVGPESYKAWLDGI